MNNLEFAIVEAFLCRGMSHREIERQIIGKDAATRGGGFEAMSVLHRYGADGTYKGAFRGAAIDRELFERGGSVQAYEGIVGILPPDQRPNVHIAQIARPPEPRIAGDSYQVQPSSSARFQVLVRADIEGCDEFAAIANIAARLRDDLTHPDVVSKIAVANQPGRNSSEVQACILPFATRYGFVSEALGLFRDAGLGLRPDYFLQFGSTGILIEVEHGKILDNNMDILDLWKCHLCSAAHYMFLFVPIKTTRGSAFERVSKRLSLFFSPGNYTNVRAVFLFGY